MIYSFIAPYSGVAELWLTEKTPGKMYCMAYPVCNENTYLGSVWFNDITDTIASVNIYVSAGTEYFIVVDSKASDESPFGLKINLPEQCPNPVIQYWGNLNICEGSSLPSFSTYWGFPNYQWYKNGLPIINQNSSSFMPTEAGSYFVEVTENGCNGQSDPVEINVSFPPDTAQIASIGPVEFCNGENVILEMINAAVGSLQWTLNGDNLLGETFNQIIATLPGAYRLSVTNGYCTLPSQDIINVVVNSNPVNIGEPVSVPSSVPEFFYTFNQDSYDEFSNYNFGCWDFIPANDRNGNFWQARDFTADDVFGYSTHYYNLPEEFTHSLWFKTSTTQGGVLLTFVDNPWGHTSQDVVIYMSDDGRIHYWMSNGGVPAELTSTDTYNDDNWHSVLISHGTGMLMEIDGGNEFHQISTPVSHLVFQGYWVFAGPAIPTTVANVPTSAFFDGVLDDMMCINEDKYILRNYLDVFPEVEVELQGSDQLCGSGLVYFDINNSQNGIQYRAWNNTLSVWHGSQTVGTGGLISFGGNVISQTCDFIIYATDPVSLCETILDTVFVITVDPILVASISISGDEASSLCSGTTVNFTASITNAGINPSLEWFFNGLPQGVNDLSFSYEFNSSSDNVYAELTTDYICPSASLATSPIISFTVLPVLTPAISILEVPTGTICRETTVDFTAIPINCGINPSFEWYLNGVNVGLDSNTFSHSSWTNEDVVHVIAFSDYACPAVPSALSNTVTLNVSTPPEADFNIISGGYCAGENICFEYAGETTGLDHVEWMLNQGGPTTLFTGIGSHCYMTLDGYLEIIVNSFDVNNCFDVADYIIPAISTSLTPSVSITSSQIGPICPYNGIVFTAFPVNCGGNPTYQWYRSGNPVGGNSSSYSESYWIDNEEVYCIVTNNLICSTSSIVESNHLVSDVSEMPEAAMSHTGGLCAGEEVCLLYSGTDNNLDYVEWEIFDGAMHYFNGIGPNCFIPLTNTLQIAVLAFNNMGCLDSTNVIIDIAGVSPNINIFDTIYHCFDNYAVFDAPTGYESYIWSNGQLTEQFYSNIDGLYYLTVTNEQSCSGIDSIFVYSYPDNSFNWPNDTTICIDAILHLDTDYPYLSYLWADGTNNLTNSWFDINYNGANPGFVSLIAEDENCIYSDTMQVHFDVCAFVNQPNSPDIMVFPNPTTNFVTFSSNETIENLMIYDLNGKIVYKSKDTFRETFIETFNWLPGEYYYLIITESSKIVKSNFIKL